MELANFLLSAGAFITSFVALLVSWYNLRVADTAARNDVVAELRSWGGEVVDLLAEAAELCEPHMSQLNLEDFQIRKSHVASRASALLDRGRFFFPKFPKNGPRPAILDLLYLTFKIIRRIDAKPESGNPPRRGGLIEIQRIFALAIQSATDSSMPRRLRKYEKSLRNVPIEAPSPEIIAIAGAEGYPFQLKFNDTAKVPDPY